MADSNEDPAARIALTGPVNASCVGADKLRITESPASSKRTVWRSRAVDGSAMSMSGHNSLAELAGAIRLAHASFGEAAEEAAARAIEAGTLLIEAKELVSHGQWASWLNANVGFSERTARRYMQLARSGLKRPRVAELGIRGAAEAIAKARALRRPPAGKELFICGDEVACVAPAHDDFWHLLVIGGSHASSLKRPVAWSALPAVLEYASAGRLSPETWWSDTAPAGFLARMQAVVDEPIDEEHCRALARMSEQEFEAFIADTLSALVQA